VIWSRPEGAGRGEANLTKIKASASAASMMAPEEQGSHSCLQIRSSSRHGCRVRIFAATLYWADLRTRRGDK